MHTQWKFAAAWSIYDGAQYCTAYAKEITRSVKSLRLVYGVDELHEKKNSNNRAKQLLRTKTVGFRLGLVH